MKYRSKLISIALLCSMILLLSGGKEVQAIILQSLQLCSKVLIPALFPYLVLSRLYASVAQETPAWLSRPIGSFFGVGSVGSSAILIGAVGGYPTGAAAIAQLYQCGKIHRAEAERLLFFACNCGPAFCCSVIGIGLYGNLLPGLWLYGIALLSSLLCGLVYPGSRTHVQIKSPPAADNQPPFLSEFVSAVGQSAKSMLQICGLVCLFSLVLHLEKVLLRDDFLYAMFAGLTELSGGVFTITALNIPWALKFSLTAAAVSFGGICVMVQTSVFLLSAGLSIKPYFYGKAVQGILAGILAWPVSHLIRHVTATSLFPTKIVAFSPWPWCILSVILTILIFLKIPTGKNGTYPL